MNSNITPINTQIYETYDYSIFKRMLGNRSVKNEQKIIDSIKKVGYILSPILVNEKYEVCDGQNRLEALKTLDMPIHFIIVPGLTIEACRALNIGQTNWAAEDYVYSYAEEGNVNFQRLASLFNEFKKSIGIEGICAFALVKSLGITGNGSYAAKFQEGKIELSQSDYELAITRMRSAINLGYVDFAKARKLRKRVYWSCVSYAYIHQDISVRDLIEKLRQSSLDIPACTNITEQLRYFDNAYNKGRHARTRVFMETDYQKGLYL